MEIPTPTTAYCQTSGIGLANTWTSDYPANPAIASDRDKRYLAAFAEKMEHAGRSANDHWSEHDLLFRVQQKLGEVYQDWQWPQDVDLLGAYDGERKNVAYLIADGNNMGDLHEWCDDRQLQALSAALTAAMDDATAIFADIIAGGFNASQKWRGE